MMNCFPESDLRRFLSQELAPERQRRVEEHVGSCAACCRVLDGLANDELVRSYFDASCRDLEALGKAAVPSADTSAAETSPDDRSEMNEWQPFLADAECLPLRFGRFVLREVIGSGGFGVVYRADDLDLEREVAVKIPHHGGLLSPDARQRFLQEGTVAATLHHPHIVQVHQSGIHRGVCFLVSEYCPGRTLHDLLRESPGVRPAQEAVRILLPLVEAVAHAHQSGVVHRDIKPANVILDARSKRDGLPFSPKLTDFGTARLMRADQSVTATGTLIGTAPYMAPEQVTGARDVGFACDVYALGVLLYELASGELPVQGKDNADTLHKLASLDPVPLDRVAGGVPRDLSAICRRCLEKNPARRYASADELAADLRRFLNHEPTAARPLGPPARLLRWSRRNPTTLAAMAAICLIFSLVCAGLSWHSSRLGELNQRLISLNGRLIVSNRQALTMKDRAEQSELHARQLQYVSAIRLAARMWREGDFRSVRNILTRLEPKAEERDFRGVEWYFLKRAIRRELDTLAEIGSALYFVRLSPDGRSFATAGRDGFIRIYDRATGKIRLSIASGQGEVNSVAYSPDGQVLASAGDDGSIRLWNTSQGKPMDGYAAHDGMAFGVEFTPDAERLISCGSDGVVHVWNNGRREATFRDHASRVEAIAVSPDGHWLASVGKDRSLVVRDLQTGELRFRWDDGKGTLSAVAFSPNSKEVAAVEISGVTKWVRLFDVASGKMTFWRQHSDGMCSVAFSPQGNRLLTTDRGGTARIWNLADRRESSAGAEPEVVWQAHTSRSYSGVFEPGGGSALTVGEDGRVSRLLVHDGTEHVLDTMALEKKSGPYARDWTLDSIIFHPNDRDILASCPAGVLLLRQDGSSTHALASPAVDNVWRRTARPREANWVVFAGSTQVGATAEGLHRPATAWRYEPESGVRRKLLQTPSNSDIPDVACSPAGDLIAVVVAPHAAEDNRKRLLLLDADTGDLLREFPAARGTKPRFTPDGRTLIFGVQRDLHLIELRRDERRVIRNAHLDSQAGLAVSRDAKWLATCSNGRELRIWNLATLKPHAVLEGHQGTISALLFSADSRTLISSSFDGTVKAWSIASGEHLMDLHRGAEGVNCMALSRDGDQLAIVEGSRRLHAYYLGRNSH